MKFTLGDISLEEYQRYLENSNYKCIFRYPQFLRAWIEAIPGTSLKFLIGEGVVIPGVVFKRGPLRAFYSLPYQTFGGPVGSLDSSLTLDFDFSNFSEVAIDDPEFKILSKGLKPIESVEAIIDLSAGYEDVFSRYSSSRRKIIRKIYRNPPDLIPLDSEKDVETFYPMYRQFAEARNIHVYPKNFFKAVVRNLGRENLFGYLAFRGSKLVGYILNVFYSGKAFAFSHVWSEKNLSSFLIDLSIRHSVESGLHTYSLGLTSPSMRGILEFKRSFGVNFKPMRTYWKKTIYHNLARNLKTSFKKWLKF